MLDSVGNIVESLNSYNEYDESTIETASAMIDFTLVDMLKNTILYYVIFALGAVLVAALIVICYLRNQQRKADMAINSIEFSTRNSREINNNNKNNNPDPQNENEGEDVIVTKNETIALEC